MFENGRCSRQGVFDMTSCETHHVARFAFAGLLGRPKVPMDSSSFPIAMELQSILIPCRICSTGSKSWAPVTDETFVRKRSSESFTQIHRHGQ